MMVDPGNYTTQGDVNAQYVEPCHQHAPKVTSGAVDGF
jgi:hypothetical protein